MMCQGYGIKAILMVLICSFDYTVDAVGSIAQLLPIKQKYLNGGQMERVTFYAHHNEDQIKAITRAGILYRPVKARATILVCHGFMCDKFDIGFLRQLLFSDYNVFMFDFRAHGERIDAEQCCTFGRDEAYDVLGAVDYIRSRPELANQPLIAYGFSMGAVAVIQASAFAIDKQNKTLFDAMILDCPYDTSQNIIKKAIENLKITVFGYTFDLPGKQLLERYAFNPWVQWMLKTALRTIAQIDATRTNTYIYPINPAESIKRVTTPCFFIHCYNDEKVTIESAQNVYANAAGYKRLWITQGRRHFDSFFYNPEKYIYKVNSFINQILSGQIPKKKFQQKVVSDFNRNFAKGVYYASKNNI